MNASRVGRRGPRAVEVVLNDDERGMLEGWARRRSSAQGLAVRARIVLGAAEGENNTELAERLGLTRMTVAKWRGRFVSDRVDGLLDEPRPGRPRTISDEKVAEVIAATLESAPRDATHWSTRSMAAQVGLSQTAVSRIWRAFGLQPHRVESRCTPKDSRNAPPPKSGQIKASEIAGAVHCGLETATYAAYATPNGVLLLLAHVPADGSQARS
jgi:transposase